MSPDLIRAVIEAARALRGNMEARADLLGERYEPLDLELLRAVQALEEAMKAEERSAKPFGRKRRPWSQVESGWMVNLPKGNYKVAGLSVGSGYARITLRAPDGKEGTFERPADEEVLCWETDGGARSLEEAIGLFAQTFPGSEVIGDGPP